MKTKNFHWHMRGRHFRDYHLLLDEHAEQIFAMTDAIAERTRKLGGATLHSISDIARHQHLLDNNDAGVTPQDMLAELCADNQQLTRFLRATHAVCDAQNDVATAQTPPKLCLPQCALKPTVLDWHESLDINIWASYLKSLILPYRSMVAQQTRAYQVRLA